MSSPKSETPFDLAALLDLVRAGVALEYVFFWGHTAKQGALGKECFSQWYPAPFVVDGTTYATAEHFMMAGKAALFDDREALERVLESKSPAAAKRAGRDVRGFDEAAWKKARFALVVEGNVAKFAQHAALKTYLLETGDKVLVEASPTDKVWGIGLAADDPRAQDPAEWQGENLLGFALMKARARLR